MRIVETRVVEEIEFRIDVSEQDQEHKAGDERVNSLWMVWTECECDFDANWEKCEIFS